MASNPPLNVMEDQTDEDFFDKLVDDEFGPPSNSDSPSKIVSEVNDSDEAKAFSNLSIEDTSAGEGEGEGGLEEKTGNNSVDGTIVELPDSHEDDSKGLDSFTTSVSDGMAQLNEDAIGSNVISDPVVNESSGSMKPGVKEVGWNSFYADSIPNGNHGGDSFSDFFNDLGDKSQGFPTGINESRDTENFPSKINEKSNVENFPSKINGSDFANNGVGVGLNDSVGYYQYQDSTQVYGGSTEASMNSQDMNSSQYWESMYPGWKYDENTGQWYPVEGYDATGSAQAFDANAGTVSGGQTEINYLQQASTSAVGTVAETSTTESVSNWNQVSQLNNNGYPEHMIFDPQYPGWYYDMIVQQWLSLESYNQSVQPTAVESIDPQSQNHAAFHNPYSHNSDNVHGEYGQGKKYVHEAYTSQGQYESWGESFGSYNQQGLNAWQPEPLARTNTGQSFGRNQQLQNPQGSNFSMNNHVDKPASLDSLKKVPSYDTMSQGHGMANGFASAQGFVPSTNFSPQFNQGIMKQHDQMNHANDFYGSQTAAVVSQQSFQSNQQFSYAPNSGRSSAGRAPHALVTFGFGGKLIVMKDGASLGSSSVENQGSTRGSISIMNLMDAVTGSNDHSLGVESGPFIYFRTLCQQAFPGPLVGGNVGNKELNKWIDERIAKCASTDMDSKKGETLRLLLSLLKIACQHYGKLRSPFGTSSSMKESDAPETAVAKLFASASKNSKQFSEYGVLSHCLQSIPSEGQIRATASEVQNLLVSGRKKEALQCAQEGQLWGPALVLASQLGDQFYVDTVKHMALCQLVAGSPLRTLCLLIAGQPAEVFSTNSMTTGQFGANCMLNDWEENLAVIAANRTKDDELVIIHLGDCLWKDRSEITAAHICYLIAEANFEAYSDSARLCLIGADHWKHPRTYASPEAIQRTELYEYSKVFGNSQFILLPFQPYKLIYAYMLAEVGKVSDSLKYCQAVLKSLKTGRAPEVESWKQLVLSLEERIRTHQQGGYTANLAPGKFVGKLLNFFDSTAQRVVGGLPPPAPSTTHGSALGDQQTLAPRVSTSQSTMAMSSLIPSASMEPISEWAADGSRMTMQSRSISEPDFGRTPRQVDPSKEGTSSGEQGKASSSTASSRFGRFGFGSQLLQKTVGLVLRPRSDKQAKLGEKNKFYYDEKLKQWVEEGAEPRAEEAALPPPPTTTAFQNGTGDYNLKSALKRDGSPPNGSPKSKNPALSEQTSGMPPIPTSSNQFSARGRMGVRARYVDTFNQGGSGASSTRLYQSPSAPSIHPVSANPKFFVPTPTPSSESLMESIAENTQDTIPAENPSSTTLNSSFQSPSPSSSMTMQRYPSMSDIGRKGMTIATSNGPGSSNSRRTASWSGSSFPSSFSPPDTTESRPRPLGEVLGMSPVPFMPENNSMPPVPPSDELQEVEL